MHGCFEKNYRDVIKMTGQTLTQRAEVERERKVLEAGSDVSNAVAGDVLTFKVLEYEEGEPRKELIVEVSERGLTTLFRLYSELIISGSRYINDSRKLNSNVIHGEERYRPSQNIARQRIYDSLNQLLNENGITQ